LPCRTEDYWICKLRAYDEVKFIQVGSDFPLQNRSICPMNIAYLNVNILKLQEVKTVDDLMTLHRNQKGIIHTVYLANCIEIETLGQYVPDNPFWHKRNNPSRTFGSATVADSIGNTFEPRYIPEQTPLGRQYSADFQKSQCA
jgi:hypothetical protein